MYYVVKNPSERNMGPLGKRTTWRKGKKRKKVSAPEEEESKEQ